MIPQHGDSLIGRLRVAFALDVAWLIITVSPSYLPFDCDIHIGNCWLLRFCVIMHQFSTTSSRIGGALRDSHLRTSSSERCLLAAYYWGPFTRLGHVQSQWNPVSVENGVCNLRNANFTRKFMRDESSWHFLGCPIFRQILIELFLSAPSFKSQPCADWKGNGFFGQHATHQPISTIVVLFPVVGWALEGYIPSGYLT